MLTRSEIYRELEALLREPMPEEPGKSTLDSMSAYFYLKNEMGKPPAALSIPGWGYFNQLTNGLPHSQFTILCGPTGAGKTTLLASLATAMMSAKIPIYTASIEIGTNEFMKKMVSCLIGKDFSEITPEEAQKTWDACFPVIGTSTSFFGKFDSRTNHKHLLAELLWAHKRGVKVAFVDNFNYMLDIKRGGDALWESDRVLHDFVVFCKKIPIHVVMVMHPRKTDGGRVVSLFDIKGSSTSVQEAANVLLFNRLEKPEDAPHGKDPWLCRELKIDKARFCGRSVGKKIILSLAEHGEKLQEVAIGAKRYQ